MIPDWLPKEIKISGISLKADYLRFYEVFKIDLLAKGMSIDGIEVVVDRSKDPLMNTYERGFTHIVTRDMGQGRTIDYERAVKIGWVKAIIDNYTKPEVRAFWHSGPKGEVLYLWLHEHNFVIILKLLKSAKENTNTSKKIIVTAYCVDGRYKYRDLEKKYKKASKIL